MSRSSLGYKPLSIVINFLVFWSIYLNSSFVHFMISPEYLTRWTAKMFIPLLIFLFQSLVSRIFLIYRRNSFFFFFFFSSTLVWWCSLSIFQSDFYFCFFSSVLILSRFDWSILSSIHHFPLFIMSIAHFLYQIPFLHPCWNYLVYDQSPSLF